MLFRPLWQVDGAVKPLGKFLLLKSAKAEEMTKANHGQPLWRYRMSQISSILCYPSFLCIHYRVPKQGRVN